MLSPIPLPWLGAGALGIAALSFWAGWQVNDWRRDAAELERTLDAEKAEDDAEAEVHKESTNYEQSREAGRVEAAGREQAVRTIYKDRPPVPASCEPPGDALRVLDNAIESANQAAGEPGASLP